MAKKIIITRDARKKCDIRILPNGALEFQKDIVVINDETKEENPPKSQVLFMRGVKFGNEDAVIESDGD